MGVTLGNVSRIGRNERFEIHGVFPYRNFLFISCKKLVDGLADRHWRKIAKVLKITAFRSQVTHSKTTATYFCSQMEVVWAYSPTFASGAKNRPPSGRHCKRNGIINSNFSLKASEADVEELCTVFGLITHRHVSRDRFTAIKMVIVMLVLRLKYMQRSLWACSTATVMIIFYCC